MLQLVCAPDVTIKFNINTSAYSKLYYASYALHHLEMAVRLSTLLCFMAAAIIQLPEAQSRTTQPTRYDAAKVSTQVYFLKKKNYIRLEILIAIK